MFFLMWCDLPGRGFASARGCFGALRLAAAQASLSRCTPECTELWKNYLHLGCLWDGPNPFGCSLQ